MLDNFTSDDYIESGHAYRPEIFGIAPDNVESLTGQCANQFLIVIDTNNLAGDGCNFLMKEVASTSACKLAVRATTDIQYLFPATQFANAAFPIHQQLRALIHASPHFLK